MRACTRARDGGRSFAGVCPEGTTTPSSTPPPHARLEGNRECTCARIPRPPSLNEQGGNTDKNRLQTKDRTPDLPAPDSACPDP